MTLLRLKYWELTEKQKKEAQLAAKIIRTKHRKAIDVWGKLDFAERHGEYVSENEITEAKNEIETVGYEFHKLTMKVARMDLANQKAFRLSLKN